MWKNRNFGILWVASLVGEMGLWFALIGNLEFMQHTVSSSFLQSLLLLAGMFAGLCIGPLAGRVLDTTGKKKVLLVVGAVRLFAVGFMFLALETDSVFWMIVYNVIIGSSGAFYAPSLQALLPMIVPKDQLLSANAAQMNAFTISRVAGAGVAGALVVAVGLYWMYVVTFASFVLLLAMTMFLQVEEKPQEASGRKKEKASFKEVLPLIKERPQVLQTLILAFVCSLFLGGFNLNVIEISEGLNDSSIKGVIYVVEGLGFMLGSFLVKRLADRFHRVALMRFSALVVILSQFSLHFSDIYWVTVLAFTTAGTALGMFYPQVATLQQTQIPSEFHGRFFTFRNMLDTVVFQLLIMTTGFMLDAVGLRTMVLIYGSIGLTILTLTIWNGRNTAGLVNEPIEKTG